jgi:uncharacterized cupin superfamily protein
VITKFWSPANGAAPQLETWPSVDPRALVAGEGLQFGQRVFHDEDGLSVGLWAAEPFTTHLMPYPVHEFMIVHEGVIMIEDAAGTVHSFGPGDAFFIPKGFLCLWRQDGRVFKTFVIHKGSEGSEVPGAGLIRVDTKTPLSALPPIPEGMLSSAEQPRLEGVTLYTDASGCFRLGLWGSDAFETHAIPYPYQEAMFLLEGGMVWESEGEVAQAGAGEPIFVSDGSVVKISTPDHAHKIFVTFAKPA